MAQHARDFERGVGWVQVPQALANKHVAAALSVPWPWFFPASRTCRHCETGKIRRHHLHETVTRRSVREAILRAGIRMRATSDSPRHYFAALLLEDGQGIRTIQELLGHKDVSSTMIYTLVLNRCPISARRRPGRIA